MKSGFVTPGNPQAAIGESGLCGRNELLAEESTRQGEEETALSRFYVGAMGWEQAVGYQRLFIVWPFYLLESFTHSSGGHSGISIYIL